MTAKSYPLQWPSGWARTHPDKTGNGDAMIELNQARDIARLQLARS
jgi:hypothetical protein